MINKYLCTHKSILCDTNKIYRSLIFAKMAQFQRFQCIFFGKYEQIHFYFTWKRSKVDLLFTKEIVPFLQILLTTSPLEEMTDLQILKAMPVFLLWSVLQLKNNSH